jgi:hypothetical protein
MGAKEDVVYIGSPCGYEIEDNQKTLVAPVNQYPLFRAEYKKQKFVPDIQNDLYNEYLDIADTLARMDIDFRILYSYFKRQSAKTVIACFDKGYKARVTGDRNVEFYISLPDLFSAKVDGLTLVSREIQALAEHFKIKEGGNLIFSCYGNKSLALVNGYDLFIAEKIATSANGNDTDKELKMLQERGIKIRFLPLPAVQVYNTIRGTRTDYPYSILDHTYAIVRGKKGGKYLLMDAKTQAYTFQDNDFRKLKLEDLYDYVSEICTLAGYVLVLTPPLSVPYSLRFRQLADNRIIMTAGDQALENLIRDLAGDDMVFTTSKPIVSFPVWKYAGIKTLFGDVPEIFFGGK